MQPRLYICLAITVFYLLAVAASPARADVPEKKGIAATAPTPEQARKAIDRGLAFLETDAAKWRKERACATCHHGTMTVWALSEATSQGYAVAAETLTDVTKWTKERLENIDKPRDTRPGWSMVSTPAVYLALMAQAVPTQDAVSPDELQRITGHLLRHQETDGSWAWSSAPARNRPPPVFESDEVVTLMAYMALGRTFRPTRVRSLRPAMPEHMRPTGSKGTSPARVRKRRHFGCSATSGRASPRENWSRESCGSWVCRTRTVAGARSGTSPVTPTPPDKPCIS
jgi:hypothetical protein